MLELVEHQLLVRDQVRRQEVGRQALGHPVRPVVLLDGHHVVRRRVAALRRGRELRQVLARRLAAVVGQLDVGAVGRLDVLLELVDEDRRSRSTSSCRRRRAPSFAISALISSSVMSLFTIATCFVAGRGAGGGRALRRRPAAARRGAVPPPADGDALPLHAPRRRARRRRARRSATASLASQSMVHQMNPPLGPACRPLLVPRAERGLDPVADAARRSRRSPAGRRRSCTAGPRGGRTRPGAASPSRRPPSRSPSPRAGCPRRRDGASRRTHLRLVVLEDRAEVGAEPDGLAVDEVAAGLVLQRVQERVVDAVHVAAFQPAAWNARPAPAVGQHQQSGSRRR